MPAARWNRSQRASLPILLTIAAAPGADRARWAPDAGERVEWRWRVESEQTLERVEVVLEPGRSTGRSMTLGDPWLEVRDVLEVTARDLVVERDEQDPIRLERELVRARRGTSSDWRLSASSRDGDAIETVSPFEGARLVFRWDVAAGEPRAELADDSEEIENEELLEGLDEGLDLRGLLGGVPRAPGDTWQLDKDALRRLVRPGGELALAAPEAEFEGQHDSAALGWLLGAALTAGEGGAWGRAEYERVSREGDRRFARIGLRATVESRGSPREALARLVDTLGSGRVWLEYARTIEVEHRLRFTGMLLWDLAAGRAHALELDGRSEARLVLGLDLWDQDWEYVASFRGDVHLRVEAAVVE